MELLLQTFLFSSTLAVIVYSISVFRLAFHPDLSKIPGPFVNRFTVWPLKLRVLTGHRTRYIHSLHQKYGQYVRIAPREISTSSIEAHKQIHRIGTEFIKSEWYHSLSPTQYDDETCGVFGLRNAKVAAARRRLFQQAGTRAAVSQWEPVIVELARQAVEQMKREATQGTADILKWWQLMTADVLSSLAFGEPFRTVEHGQKSQLVKDIEESMILVGLYTELPWIWHVIKHIPLPHLGRPLDFFKRFENYANMAVRNTKAAKPGSAKTLFSKMVPEDEESRRVPDSVVKMECINIMIAGTDTTATALTFLTYEVLKNPPVQAKLVEELQSCSENPGWDELEAKPYLNRVITETLRLYPPTSASLTRTAPSGTILAGKYPLPGWAVVGTQAWTYHRDPTVFPNPERFDPDRWISPTSEMKEHLMAFGGATRVCIGQNVARLELLHAVSRFFRECPNARLAETTIDESMRVLDFFVIKPTSGKCEITMV